MTSAWTRAWEVSTSLTTAMTNWYSTCLVSIHAIRVILPHLLENLNGPAMTVLIWVIMSRARSSWYLTLLALRLASYQPWRNPQVKTRKLLKIAVKTLWWTLVLISVLDLCVIVRPLMVTCVVMSVLLSTVIMIECYIIHHNAVTLHKSHQITPVITDPLETPHRIMNHLHSN